MKLSKRAYTTGFQELAVKRVHDGESIPAVVKELGLSDQTLRNWVKAAAQGKLKGAGRKAVTPQEMELSRLRAENGRLKRENEIIKNAMRYGMNYKDPGADHYEHQYRDRVIKQLHRRAAEFGFALHAATTETPTPVGSVS